LMVILTSSCSGSSADVVMFCSRSPSRANHANSSFLIYVLCAYCKAISFNVPLNVLQRQLREDNTKYNQVKIEGWDIIQTQSMLAHMLNSLSDCT
jgi:hypothetical protein